MLKKKSFLIFFVMICTLVLVYQNCGQLQNGGDIFSACSFGGNCAEGNINDLSVTPDTTHLNAAGQYVIPVTTNTAVSSTFNNVSIQGTCTNGNFPKTIVKAVINGSNFLCNGTTCSFSSYCSTDGHFDIEGYAPLSTNGTYSVTLEIAALNQYLQEVYGPNSFAPERGVQIINTQPPVLSSLSCLPTQTIADCLANSNSSNFWRFPAGGYTINNSATIFTSSASTINLDQVKGYCTYGSGDNNVTIYVVPYGYSYSELLSSGYVPKVAKCKPFDANQNVGPHVQGYTGYFDSTNPGIDGMTPPTIAFDNASSVVPCHGDTNCLSTPFNKAGSRLYQIVVAQNMSISGGGTIPISSNRNAFVQFQNLASGNYWDANMLQENLKRIAKAFTFSAGTPSGYFSGSTLTSAQAIYNRSVSGVGTSGNPFVSCTSLGSNQYYYFGTRSWIIYALLGNFESPGNGALPAPAALACPTSGTVIPNMQITSTGSDSMQFSQMALNQNCDLNATSGFDPIHNVTGDIEAKRIAACLTARYLMGMWQPSNSSNLYAYADKFTRTGVNCSGSNCATCTFQDNSAVSNTKGGSGNDCAILMAFYNAASSYKTTFGVGTISSLPNPMQTRPYQAFYGKMAQYYINYIMNDLSANTTLKNKIFSTAYQNITDPTVMTSMQIKEFNYLSSPASFGAMYNNNFPDGKYNNN